MMHQTKIGTYAWVQKENGRLNFKEKIKMFQKLIIPSIVTPLKETLHRKNLNTDFKIDHIIIPDTKMVQIATEVLEEKASVAIIHHSWRTYFWGAAFLIKTKRY